MDLSYGLRFVRPEALQIKALIAQACHTPESYMEMRRMQLRDMAFLNGTVRAEDVLGAWRLF